MDYPWQSPRWHTGQTRWRTPGTDGGRLLRRKVGAKGKNAEFEGVADASKPLRSAWPTHSRQVQGGHLGCHGKNLLSIHLIEHSHFSMRNSVAPADAAAIAKLFKGGRRDRIEAILESLQSLGHAHEVENGKSSA